MRSAIGLIYCSMVRHAFSVYVTHSVENQYNCRQSRVKFVYRVHVAIHIIHDSKHIKWKAQENQIHQEKGSGKRKR